MIIEPDQKDTIQIKNIFKMNKMAVNPFEEKMKEMLAKKAKEDMELRRIASLAGDIEEKPETEV